MNWCSGLIGCKHDHKNWEVVQEWAQKGGKLTYLCHDLGREESNTAMYAKGALDELSHFLQKHSRCIRKKSAADYYGTLTVVGMKDPVIAQTVRRFLPGARLVEPITAAKWSTYTEDDEEEPLFAKSKEMDAATPDKAKGTLRICDNPQILRDYVTLIANHELKKGDIPSLTSHSIGVGATVWNPFWAFKKTTKQIWCGLKYAEGSLPIDLTMELKLICKSTVIWSTTNAHRYQSGCEWGRNQTVTTWIANLDKAIKRSPNSPVLLEYRLEKLPPLGS